MPKLKVISQQLFQLRVMLLASHQEVAGSSSEYGHVAFVEKVYSDNSILVSEMNVKGNNIVSERHISAGVAALATYIQPK